LGPHPETKLSSTLIEGLEDTMNGLVKNDKVLITGGDWRGKRGIVMVTPGPNDEYVWVQIVLLDTPYPAQVLPANLVRI
jgi:hypothetical protein